MPVIVFVFVFVCVCVCVCVPCVCVWAHRSAAVVGTFVHALSTDHFSFFENIQKLNEKIASDEKAAGGEEELPEPAAGMSCDIVCSSLFVFFLHAKSVSF